MSDPAERTEPTEPTLRELRLRATRSLGGHGNRPPAVVLAEMTDVLGEIEPDRYGEGGVVAELETEMATLLGKPTAVFMPSGTMAQQIALRLHADRTGRRTVLWHPTCHVGQWEDQAAERLHGLHPRPVGDARALITLEDLQEVAEPAAALLIELPQREIGGRLPAWDDLVAQIGWARERGTAAHLDGARLFESLPFYGRPAAEVAALFDSVYVSLYKGLGGLAGCVLAGDEALVAQAREWRHRHGGTLFEMWPYAAAGLVGLRLRAPRMRAYLDHALAIAAALTDVPSVEVVPYPPVTPMMHLYLQGEAGTLDAALRRLATEQGLWTWTRTARTDLPRCQVVELSVGDATLEFSPEEVAGIVADVVSG